MYIQIIIEDFLYRLCGPMLSHEQLHILSVLVDKMHQIGICHSLTWFVVFVIATLAAVVSLTTWRRSDVVTMLFHALSRVSIFRYICLMAGQVKARKTANTNFVVITFGHSSAQSCSQKY